MRILWLLTQLPYPPDTGGRQDSYFLMRQFIRRAHRVTAGIVFSGEKPPDTPPEFSDLVEKVVYLPGNPKALHSRLLGSLSDDTPFKFRKYFSNDAVRIVADYLRSEQDFDVVLIDHLHVAPLALTVRDRLREEGVRIPQLVLRTPNVESTIVSKYAKRVDNPLVKAFAAREARKMVAYEAKVLSEFDLVAAISPVDQGRFIDMSERPAKIVCVTAGVDIDTLHPPETRPEPGEVVYVGTFDWQPNVDGALWLINKVWPGVLEAFPSAHLSLVGKKPPPLLEKFASDSISLTGRVDSVEEYVTKASCSVVPLWIGSGMRLKILEAFALGQAVVSTSLGAEGIEVEDGREILIRDTPDAFARAIVEVLSDENLRTDLGGNARALVERKYSWEQVADGFMEQIKDLI